ncbi:hypothetical protein Tco_0711592 [Tanacetum coccineum]
MISWDINLLKVCSKRFALRRRCSKETDRSLKDCPDGLTKLPDFKERWTEEMGYIQVVSEVMRISSFMSNSKCPELARRFADQTVGGCPRIRKAQLVPEWGGGLDEHTDNLSSDPIRRCVR